MSIRNERLIQVKYIYNSIGLVTDLSCDANMECMLSQVRDLCRFPPDYQFSLKWIDEEDDACVLSSDMELNEAIRLFEGNKDVKYLDEHLNVMVFNGVPMAPGLPCPGEDSNINRRGAKRWKKKFYLLHGHTFAARRFNRNAQCAYCHGRIWGLGQPGFKCTVCRLLLHRRCRGCVQHKCGEAPKLPTPVDSDAVQVIKVSHRDDSNVSSASSDPSMRDIITDEKLNQCRNRSGCANLAFQDTRKHVLVNEANKKQASSISIKEECVSEMDIAGVDERIGLSNFHLLKVVGRGSYAKVFQVEHIQTGRIYAMKVIKKETILDEEDIEWVQTEKHVFECATNHPFLVGLHSCFQTLSRLYFVIEFVNGGDLMYYMQRHFRLPVDYARFYAGEICLALNFLHERGILYRDLKLDNVLMDGEGHIKLTDYGMCKEGISGDVTTSTFCGTPNYIAPEILLGKSYNSSVDWWAMGVLLFEMLAGRSPWDGVGQSANPDQNTEEYLFQVILTHPIRYPRWVEVCAANILRAFLTKEPTERLGCQPHSNFADIMNHPFFRSIDWVALEQKQITPPHRPVYEDNYDLTHFDPTFTDELVEFTPDVEEVIAKIDQTEFDGFEYLNPLLMSAEEAV